MPPFHLIVKSEKHVFLILYCIFIFIFIRLIFVRIFSFWVTFFWCLREILHSFYHVMLFFGLFVCIPMMSHSVEFGTFCM